MEPFQRNYLIEKINEYNSKIKEGNIGEYKIIKTCEKRNLGYLHKKEENIEIPIPKLLNGNSCVMKISPLEIQSSYETIKYARGNVGVVGLGIGYVVQEMAKKQEVKEVTVYECSKEIIDLYLNNFGENSKIKIIYGDAYKSSRKNFDYFFVDLYNYELSNKAVEDYKLFNKLHRIEEYVFWGVEHFLLSCSYEEIVWVYIPEIWMMMSKDIFGALDSSGYIDYYEKLDDNLVNNTLMEFKKILNEEE